MPPEPSNQTLAQSAFRQKEVRRRALGMLSFEQKIDLLIRLQHLASDIRREVGGTYRRPWRINQ
ncbi:MAG: hypothetical protein JNM56_18425 [Planctomycetia bacterium]|nr:hypothetical protein [Planctomycetia bacterium]